MAAQLRTHYFDGMDDETAALTIQLELEDINALLASALVKGNGKDGRTTDWQLALNTQKAELERSCSYIVGRQVAANRVSVLDHHAGFPSDAI